MPSQFGQLFEVIVGAVSGIAMGSSLASESAATKRYVSRIEQTQQRSAQEALTTAQQQVALQEQASAAKETTSALANTRMRQVTILAVLLAIMISIFAIIVFYHVAVGGENG